MDEKAKVYSVLSNLDIAWHRILGVCGNHYLGNKENELLLTVLYYKRFCDNLDELHLENEDFCNLEEVSERSNLYESLNNAVKKLNELNITSDLCFYKKIPEFYCAETDREDINKVLVEWFRFLSEISLDNYTVSVEEWDWIMEKIRRK